MTWYISDDFSADRRANPRSRWCDAERVEPIARGDASRCPQCGRYITLLKWLEPRRIRLTNSRYPDRLHYYLHVDQEIIVSERFMNAYKSSGLQGITAFRPIETVKVARNHDPSTFPKYYSAEVEVTTDIKLDPDQTIIHGSPRDWKCSLCNPFGSSKSCVEKYVLDVKSTDLDIAWVYALGIVMSQCFYDFVQEHNFTNFNLVDISEYQYGMDKGPGPNKKL